MTVMWSRLLICYLAGTASPGQDEVLLILARPCLITTVAGWIDTLTAEQDSYLHSWQQGT